MQAIVERASYIGVDSPASAERFLLATEATFQQLDEMSGMGHRYRTKNRRLRDLRVWAVKGFPNHLIFYRPAADGIEIVHLLHGARNIPAAMRSALERGEI